MATQVKLSRQTLRIILLLQARQALAKRESTLKLSSDWHSKTKEYFESFADDLLANAGLIKANPCLDAMLEFEITDKMRYLIYEEMLDYNFSY